MPLLTATARGEDCDGDVEVIHLVVAAYAHATPSPCAAPSSDATTSTRGGNGGCHTSGCWPPACRSARRAACSRRRAAASPTSSTTAATTARTATPDRTAERLVNNPWQPAVHQRLRRPPVPRDWGCGSVRAVLVAERHDDTHIINGIWCWLCRRAVHSDCLALDKPATWG